MENYDLKTTAWKEEDINVRNSIQKKVRLGNQMMLILVFDFALLSQFFCKKLKSSYILQDFLFGIGIWFWAVENLESSHHVSAVRD